MRCYDPLARRKKREELYAAPVGIRKRIGRVRDAFVCTPRRLVSRKPLRMLHPTFAASRNRSRPRAICRRKYARLRETFVIRRANIDFLRWLRAQSNQTQIGLIGNQCERPYCPELPFIHNWLLLRVDVNGRKYFLSHYFRIFNFYKLLFTRLIKFC